MGYDKCIYIGICAYMSINIAINTLGILKKRTYGKYLGILFFLLNTYICFIWDNIGSALFPCKLHYTGMVIASICICMSFFTYYKGLNASGA